MFKFKSFKKEYLTLIFIVATFMGVFHHHDDLKQHNDCQICIIQSSIADADTPIEAIYFTLLNIKPEAVVKTPKTIYSKTLTNPLKARAPPSLV